MRLLIAFTIAMMIVPSIGKAVEIGDFPGLSQLIEKSDAVVILRIDQHFDVRPNPTLYTKHKCYIYQTLKGDILAEKSIALRLMDTRTSFVTPFALNSTHLMFLTKKRSHNEPTDFRTIEFQGANIALSPFGHEKPPKGKAVAKKVMHLVRNAIDYRKQQHEKEQRFLSLLQAEKTATVDEPGERAKYVVIAGTFDVDDEAKIIELLKSSHIPFKAGGEFGIWFSVPAKKRSPAIELLEKNGFRESIWRKNDS